MNGTGRRWVEDIIDVIFQGAFLRLSDDRIGGGFLPLEQFVVQGRGQTDAFADGEVEQNGDAILVPKCAAAVHCLLARMVAQQGHGVVVPVDKIRRGCVSPAGL